MAKVLGPGTGPKFKKPVPTTPPLSAFDPAYLERKAGITEREFKLKSGRKLAYWTEGDPSDKALLCLPALGNSKCSYIFPKPLQGVYQISVDRPGHGDSGVLEGKEEWKLACDEMLELMDDLKVAGLALRSKSIFDTLYLYFRRPVLGCIDADLCK